MGTNVGGAGGMTSGMYNIQTPNLYNQLLTSGQQYNYTPYTFNSPSGYGSYNFMFPNYGEQSVMGQSAMGQSAMGQPMGGMEKVGGNAPMLAGVDRGVSQTTRTGFEALHNKPSPDRNLNLLENLKMMIQGKLQNLTERPIQTGITGLAGLLGTAIAGVPGNMIASNITQNRFNAYNTAQADKQFNIANQATNRQEAERRARMKEAYGGTREKVGGGREGGGIGCFLKGTKVTMADNTIKQIEEIKENDLVMGFDDKKAIPLKVGQVFYHNDIKEYLIIKAGDKELRVTLEHCIFDGEDYTPAISFVAGNYIFLLKDNELEPCEIEYIYEEVSENIEVYNLKTENMHNYFAEGILVHNRKA